MTHQRPTLSGLDLAAPGGLDELFAYHRRRFGGATMTADPADAGKAPEVDANAAGKRSYTPPATQDEFDRAVNARVAREREKFADYEDLKVKAAEHDKSVEASRSEQEKAVEAAKSEGRTAATREANEKAALAILKAGLSARGVSADDAKGLLEAVNVSAFIAGDDVDTDKVAAYANRVAGAPSQQRYDFGQGYRPNVGQGFGSAGKAEAERRYPKPTQQ